VSVLMSLCDAAHCEVMLRLSVTSSLRCCAVVHMRSNSQGDTALIDISSSRITKATSSAFTGDGWTEVV
jgi:hypothetical protein